MNKSFSAYTPRPRPLDYDAILGRDGCEPESGNSFYGLLAFEELCVAPHSATSAVFNQPATVSYSLGPYYKGIPQEPYVTMWSAWVATAGIRVGKVGPVVPPANTTGELSSLYPEATPSALTHAWDASGLLAIAIQKTADTIELKHYLDTSGTNIGTYTWAGQSPALFYTGLVVKADPAASPLVCYYLKAADGGKTIYARFSADAWATEQIIIPTLRIGLARLISATSYGAKVQLFALDTQGRDVTLTTPQHAVGGLDAATLAVALAGGNVYVVAQDFGLAGTDKATLDIAAPFGQVFEPLTDPTDPPPAEKASLSVAFIGGEVL